jgi:hypothetical protein
LSDIFISYAREDLDKARELARFLSEESTREWSVWWDRALLPGMSYDEVIERELNTAKAVVVLWSNASLPSTWVRNEAREGLRRNVLVPAFVEPIAPPLEFRNVHGAILSRWPLEPHDEELMTLYRALERLIGSPRTDAPAPRDAPRATAVEMPARPHAPLRFFVYLSDAKVDMLHAQLVNSPQRSSRTDVQSRYEKLQCVEEQLRLRGAVGALGDEASWIEATAEMQSGVSGDLVLYFGTAAGVRLVLGGAAHHLVDRSRPAQMSSRGSYLQFIVNELHALIDSPEATSGSAPSSSSSRMSVEGGNPQSRNNLYWIASMLPSFLEGPPQKLHFLAKTLAIEKNPPHRQPPLILATPLYVALE